MKAVLIMLAAAVLPMPTVAAHGSEATPRTELTRVAEPGAPRPAASLAELGWLVGTWEGEGIGGAPSMESWSAPVGGTMPGIFVQTDGKGGTMFSEYMQIAPDGESLVVRLKHFNVDLTGWEEKDRTITFPLIGRSQNALYFNGLTYERSGSDRLTIAVRMHKADGRSNELVFRLHRKVR